ncbi:MAG: hypothetical protein ACKESB_02310 [Candidatus Hodgkinia cicadicola]
MEVCEVGALSSTVLVLNVPLKLFRRRTNEVAQSVPFRDPLQVLISSLLVAKQQMLTHVVIKD